MLNNSNNLTFSPLTAILLCSYHNLDFIMIESIHRVISLDKYIIFPVRYYYKSKASACTFKCTNKCYILRLHVLTLLRYAYCSICDKTVKHLHKLRTLSFRNIEKHSDFFSFHWNIQFIIKNHISKHLSSLFKYILLHIPYIPFLPLKYPDYTRLPVKAKTLLRNYPFLKSVRNLEIKIKYNCYNNKKNYKNLGYLNKLAFH